VRPAARGPIRPTDAWKHVYKDLNFYMSEVATAAATEIMRDLRGFLLGIFYSTSGSCPTRTSGGRCGNHPRASPTPTRSPMNYRRFSVSRRWTITSASSHAQALSPRTTGMRRSTRVGNTSFLDSAVVQQPALFLTGERDLSLKPIFGIDRQGPALKPHETSFRDMREIKMIPGSVIHHPKKARTRSTPSFTLSFAIWA
jgi:hypothetical protein